MLTHAAFAALAAAVLMAAPSEPIGNTEERPPASQSAGATVGPEGLEANVTSTSTAGGTVPFSRTVRVRVPVMCWMTAGATGAEYAEDWGEGGQSYKVNGGSSGYSYTHLVYPNFMDYADKDGHWYTSTCRSDAPAGVIVEYFRTHPARFVETGQPVPVGEPAIDPRVLMEAARDAMVLPTGTIRWNPSMQGSGATVVNMSTFVWVENSTTAVQVRAEIPATNTWAQIDAGMATLTLTADGAVQDEACTDNGTPYTAGMTTSSCSITFTRSSANQPIKPGQTLRTSTLTATANWTATWNSSLDATPQALTIPPTTTSAEIPVAEIQTVVTR